MNNQTTIEHQYESVIGLEVHAQLLTESKIFCGCSTKYGSSPNTNVCPVCLGHPGVLPVLNKKVVEFAVRMGLAVNCTINTRSIFARKNYFYPDLPKGYQISQLELPLCENGFLEIDTENKTKRKIRIKRIHLEEDAGKLIHQKGSKSFVDLNRAGIPLIEIVSEPDIQSSAEAYNYLTELKKILQYLEICDGNMEEGSLRCDANISIRKKGESKLGVKTEIKNLNSFRNVERALNFELERQIEIIQNGGVITQQTLLWNADLNEAKVMRSKEEAQDYRYFPDPDLLPILIEDEWKISIESSLPELPAKKKERFTIQYKLPDYDSEILTQEKKLADYYEQVVTVTDDFKSASNWIMVDVLKILNEQRTDISGFRISPTELGKLINLINNGIISSRIAREVFSDMLVSGKDAESIISEKDLSQISDLAQLEKIIGKIFAEREKEILEYISGKEKVIGFFVGQIMKETKGTANPNLLTDLLRQKLEELKSNFNHK